MSKKKTLADLMDNDFFIDFDDTKAKVERKRLTESFKGKRALIESIEESEVESCYKRVCASAAAEKDQAINDPDEIMIAVEVSKEHLKKALKLGAFSTYTGNEPYTVPAQYVESVDLEFSNNIILDSDNCQLAVILHGEYEDESVNDYIGDVCFVQFRDYPAFDTEEEALEFFETEIRPNATKIAEEMIDEAWAKSGCTDYEGITDMSGEDEEDKEPEDDSDVSEADSWESLIEQADSLLAELASKSGNADSDDGDGYWITEYTVWCNRYLYHTDKLNNEDDLKTLCDEYSKKLPGVTFYCSVDAEEELCELGYEASKQVEESKLNEDYEYDLTEDTIYEEDLYKALVTNGELVVLNAGNTGESVSFKDGGVYCDTRYEVTESDGKFSVTEFYNSDDGESKEGDYYFETDSFETLCAELQKIFPNTHIERKMTEEVKELDNAVVDCKVNKVIAHCEDEKPVDCLGEKKPLEKPLTEEPNKMTAAELKDKHGTDDVDIINAGREEQDRVELKEARTPDEIRAEIEKLQQELADAEAAEKKASYGGNVPTEVWIYDMYLDPADKGTWTSAELDNGKWDGYVYETEDAALDGAWNHLCELEDEDELEGDPDEYTIEAFAVPVSDVDEDTLSFSNLDHLIVESLKESRSDVDSVRIMAWCCHHCVDFFESVANNAAKTKQRRLNKAAYKAMQEKFGLATPEAEELMSKGYALWKNLYYKK